MLQSLWRCVCCAKLQFESNSQHVSTNIVPDACCAKLQFESDSQLRCHNDQLKEGCAKLQFESDSQHPKVS